MTWWKEFCSETKAQIWPCSLPPGHLWASALPSLSLFPSADGGEDRALSGLLRACHAVTCTRLWVPVQERGRRGRPSFVGGTERGWGSIGPGGAAPGNTQLPFCTQPCQTAWMLHAHRGLGSLPGPGDITYENNQETAPAVRELPANPSESHCHGQRFLSCLLQRFFSFRSEV